MADDLGRHWLTFELDRKYLEISALRFDNDPIAHECIRDYGRGYVSLRQRRVAGSFQICEGISGG